MTQERFTEQIHLEPIASVTDFLSASQNNDPLLYPGQRPESSYLTDGRGIYNIETQITEEGLQFFMTDASGARMPVDEYLRQAGVPTMDERIPVLAFGANVSPGSLASKFKKVGRDDALIIPTIYASLPGHDVVWSGGPGVRGNLIAILYEGEETKDTSVNVAVNFLTREQLLVMHATELSYDLSSVDVDVRTNGAQGGAKIRAYYYCGNDNVYLRDGKPVAVGSINATGRTLPGESTEKLLDELFADPDIMAAVAGKHPELQDATARDFVNFVKTLEDPAARLTLKREIHAVIADLGKSKKVRPADARTRLESWANPSTLPTWGEQKQGIWHHDLYVLPSQELREWPNAEARRDVLSKVGRHLVLSSGGQLTEIEP